MIAGVMTGDHTLAMIAGDHDASNFALQMSLSESTGAVRIEIPLKDFVRLDQEILLRTGSRMNAYIPCQWLEARRKIIAHDCQKTYIHRYTATVITWASNYHLCFGVASQAVTYNALRRGRPTASQSCLNRQSDQSLLTYGPLVM